MDIRISLRAPRLDKKNIILFFKYFYKKIFIKKFLKKIFIKKIDSNILLHIVMAETHGAHKTWLYKLVVLFN